MLTAIKNSNNQKVIGNFIKKETNESYFCEYCGNEVIHHKSESNLKIGHFKHKSKQSNCLNGENESLEHLKTKLDIYEYIKTSYESSLRLIETEKWICNRSIRSDIYVETKLGNKITIEVQASSLTIDDITKRTQKYTRNEIYVMWVLPFDSRRFKLPKDDYYLANKVRLKEYEIFMYWAYFKKLIMWDLNHSKSKYFTIIELNEYKNDGAEFYRDGEEHSYDGKIAKTVKLVKRIFHNIEFSQFRQSKVNAFEVRNRGYTVPERLILNIEKIK